MEDKDIELLSRGDQLQEVSAVLQEFLQNNENTFTFPNLSVSNRVLLWTALFQHLQKNESEPVHIMCLATIRILSRDEKDLDTLICENWIVVLIDRAGLYNFVCLDEESMMLLDLQEKEMAVEALKCLCNITYHSKIARALCAGTVIAQGLVARLRVYKDIPFKDDIILYDMKILFILTALRPDIKAKIRDELHGMDYLTSCLNEIVQEASSEAENASGGSGDGGHLYLTDDKQAIAIQILKTQFNLIVQSGPEKKVTEAEESMYLKLMPVVTPLFSAHCSTQEKMQELHNNVANLLTSVPMTFYSFLSPLLNEGESSTYEYDGRNMDAVQCLVKLLHQRLAATTVSDICNINIDVDNVAKLLSNLDPSESAEPDYRKTRLYENLSPILTVMIKCVRGERAHRKYLRQVVLPPLRDVSRPPEQGDTLRNQLCRLLTTPITVIRDMVADFLFVLCKEKVGRMVKYTGFGNAAGHLAQKGLLGGSRGGQYSSSSDDSDTEEYLEAAPTFDPVVGCTRPPRPDPFHGMSEDQKEYEALKLVHVLDRLVTDGVVKPARVGPDGRPQAVEHVLQLRDQPPRRPQS